MTGIRVDDSPSPAALSDAIGLLAYRKYAPPTLVTYTPTVTSYVDVDATNLSITFVAPASGKVLVAQEAVCSSAATSSQLAWNLRDASGDIPGTNRYMTVLPSLRFRSEVLVDGLTPGQEYTWKWGHARPAGTGTVATFAQSALNAEFPAVMEVRSA